MSAEEIKLIPLQEIVPLPTNVTVIGREEDLMLRTDMTRLESKGLYKIDPILVRRLSPEEIAQTKAKQPWSQAQYMIIDGHRRFYAARELGWNQIRARVIDTALDEAREFNYKKNKVRGVVAPMREAAYFRKLHEALTIDQIADKFGMSHREVERILSRLKITEKAKAIVRGDSAVTSTHYEILGTVEEPEKQEKLADLIVKEKLSSREAVVAKEAIEKGLPPEKAVAVVKAVKREKIEPKEAKLVVEAVATKPEIAEQMLALPKEKLVEETQKIVAPAAPIGEIEIGEIKCSECGKSFKILHVNDEKHKLKKAGGLRGAMERVRRVIET